MDNQTLTVLEQATQALLHLFEQNQALDQMETVEKLLHVRDLCLSRFDSDIRPILQEPGVSVRLERILAADRVIGAGMMKLQDEAQRNIQKLKETQRVQSKYDGYNSTEGYLFDKEY